MILSIVFTSGYFSPFILPEKYDLQIATIILGKDHTQVECTASQSPIEFADLLLSQRGLCFLGKGSFIGH